MWSEHVFPCREKTIIYLIKHDDRKKFMSNSNFAALGLDTWSGFKGSSPTMSTPRMVATSTGGFTMGAEPTGRGGETGCEGGLESGTVVVASATGGGRL